MAYCVLDASVAIAWAMPDEVSPPADLWMRISLAGAIVPAHWPLEIMNMLASASRRQRIKPAGSLNILHALIDLNVAVDDLASDRWPSTLLLALDRGLTVYDAAYLSLAIRRGLPLATLDQRLKDAARAEGVVLV